MDPRQVSPQHADPMHPDPVHPDPVHPDPGTPYDPLRLCVFATVALVAWLAGPVAVLFFAGLGFAGYARARRAGLLRSRCKLGDTRLVLVYLALLVLAGVAGTIRALTGGHLGV